jgi:peptide-methionine (S)-S-oxide reductase
MFETATSASTAGWWGRGVLLGGFVLAGIVLSAGTRAPREPKAIPPFKPDTATSSATTGSGGATRETAVLAGGCFWGVQGVFQHVHGVSNAVSGYAGGDARTARYETVGSGETGHAESVEITYDPRIVSYARLLEIFFSVAHDPTQLDRQGPDSGTQYRSAIFPANDEQARVAKAYIAQLNQARAFDAAIVTRIESGRTFHPAEGYHQDYLTLHPDQPYIRIHDLPKIDDLRKLFPSLYRADPALVSEAR